MRGQVHWVQQARARLHPGYVLSLRLGEYVNHPGQTPAGGMGHSAKASMAETGAANINTCSGPNQARYIRDAGATSTAIWSREPRGYFRSSPLRGVHPTQDVPVYIDNNGVLRNWDRGREDDPRGRLQQGGRALWNRILGMKRYRADRDQGGNTTPVWVHSHVDDKDRRERKPKKARVRGISPQCNVHVGGMRKGTASQSTMHM